MGLFGRKRSQHTLTVEKPACLHMALTARWDSVADMGNDDRATAFVCASCGAQFTPAEASTIRASQADQLRKDLGADA
jgi:hypothetical protein